MDMGNLGFPNFSNYNTNSSEESDSDESGYNIEDSTSSDESSTSHDDSSNSSEEEVETTFDSIIQFPKKKYHACFKITPNDVSEIEKTLDLYQFVSVMFLLFDSRAMIEFALQEMRTMIVAGPNNFSRDKLSKWAQTPIKNWNYKLLEALAIIQNCSVLIKLGFCKEDINVMRNVPQHISMIKKLLYSHVCDYLKSEQALKLINEVRNDAKFDNDITLDCDPRYLEFHLLFWISQNYINIEGEVPHLSNLTKHLKTIDFQSYVEISEGVTVWLRNSCPESDQSKTRQIENNDEDECYKIRDPDNPGLFLLINNAKFEGNREKRKEFQDELLHKHLNDRDGTEADERKLVTTFGNCLKYTIVVRHDVVHDKMVDEIHNVIRNKFKPASHSVIVLCILSHGEEGKVYGSNSIPIKTTEISNALGCSDLVGILAGVPKVIIIQACQGANFLCDEPKKDLLVPDGPGAGRAKGPESIRSEQYHPDAVKDKVICMATIKGFVALRSPKSGAKYIQELCRCIKKYHGEKHFMDIMTKVHHNLSIERFNVAGYNENRGLCMVPEIMTYSLCKSLYLSSKQATSRLGKISSSR